MEHERRFNKYNKIELMDAIFGGSLTGKFSDAVNAAASLDRFRDILITDLINKFPGVDVTITTVPGLSGSCDTTIRGPKDSASKEMVDEVGEYYMLLIGRTLASGDWIVINEGRSLSAVDHMLLAVSPMVVEEAMNRMRESMRSGYDGGPSQSRDDIREIVEKIRSTLSSDTQVNVHVMSGTTDELLSEIKKVMGKKRRDDMPH